MHKLSIFGLTLVTMLFLAATTSMSMQVFASEDRDKKDYYSDDRRSGYEEKDKSYYEKDPRGDSYGDMKSKHDSYGDSYSKSYDDSYGDSYGDMKSKHDSYGDKYPPKDPKPPKVDADIFCEECFKYWLHFLEGQNQNFIRAISNAINDVNFGEDECDGSAMAPDDCLPVPGPGTPNISALAQLYEICEALELLIEEDHTFVELVTEATEQGETGDLRINGQPELQVLAGIIECLVESWLPVAFPNAM